MTTEEAGPSDGGVGTRTSTRVRNKSARAIESAQSDRLLAAAKVAAKEADKTRGKGKQKDETGAVDGEAGEGDEGKEDDQAEVTGRRSRRARDPAPSANASVKKPRKSKYCLCHEARKGPMIECETCDNWFHFDCIDLSEEEADRIQKYVCAACNEKTGETTTYAGDTANAAAQDDDDKPEDIENAKEPIAKGKRKARKPPTKSKAKGKGKSRAPKPSEDADDFDAADKEASASEASASESESDAAPSDADTDASEASVPSPRKRARRAPAPMTTTSPKVRPAVRRGSTSGQGGRSSSSIPPTPLTGVPATPLSGALPPARKYVSDKMASAVRALFGEDKMDEAAAETYGRQVEAALYNHLKEVIKGKEVAGGRYKAQFNLIYSSLSKTADVREDLRAAIVDGKITPAKLAFLTSSELANAEQLAFIEAAQKESLRQTVKIKEQAVRIVAGRDGLERIDENGQRMDMDREVERDEERRQSMQELKRRESVEVPSATTPIASPLSPMDEKRTPEPRPEPVKRGSSGFTATSPYKSTVALHSAWGDAASPEAVDEEADVDGEIDLSGIADEDYASMDEDEPEEKAQVDTATEPEPEPKKNDVDDFNARSVLWSGNLVNPASEAPRSVPVQLRLAAGRTSRPEGYWTHLLPHPTIAITGRVPTSHSLQYLTDRLMDKSRELVTVAFTLSPTSSPEQVSEWTKVIDFHINRDRHGIYHAYGDKPPPGAARELYLIPVRSGDVRPELFGLLDGFSLPNIDQGVIVGVFVVNREVPTVRPPRPTSIPSARPTGPPPPPPGPAAPLGQNPAVPNMNLQALMANLDPAAIAGVLRPPPPPPAAPGYSPAQYAPTPNPHHQDDYRPRSEEYRPDPYPAPSRPPFPPQSGGYYPPPPPGYGAGPTGPLRPPGPAPAAGYNPPSAYPPPPRQQPPPPPARGGEFQNQRGWRGRGRGRGRGQW